MYRMLLRDHWIMRDGDREYGCSVPCSAYDTLIRAGAIPDPYQGENEWISTPVSDRDFTFETCFVPAPEILSSDRSVLTFEGIDTLADLSLNGKQLGHTDNMHRIWEYDVTGILQEGENHLVVQVRSPSRYIARKAAERPLWGVDSTMEGYPWLRKAHCMFGWDWGPVLPDEGIWRDVSLTGFSGGRIRDVYYTQRHDRGTVLLSCRANLETLADETEAWWTVESPDGQVWQIPLKEGQGDLLLEAPMLWWVRGLGGQPLYRCRVELKRHQAVLDIQERLIGLRTLTVSQETDEWGREFCFINNGSISR